MSEAARIAAARELDERLPLAAELYEAGLVGYSHVAVLTRATLGLSDEQAKDAWDRRAVRFHPTGHGMGSLSADMAAADLAATKAALTAMAKGMVAQDQADHRENPDTPVRTMDQARADAPATVGRRGLLDPDLPAQHGRRPDVNVTVALSFCGSVGRARFTKPVTEAERADRDRKTQEREVEQANSASGDHGTDDAITHDDVSDDDVTDEDDGPDLAAPA